MTEDFTKYDINLISFYNNNKFKNKFFITYNFTKHNFTLNEINFNSDDFFLEKLNDNFFVLKLLNLSNEYEIKLIKFYDKINYKILTEFNIRDKFDKKIQYKLFNQLYSRFNFYIINKKILKVDNDYFDLTHSELISVLKSDINVNLSFTPKYFIIKNKTIILHFYIKNICIKKEDVDKLPKRLALIIKYGENSSIYKINNDLSNIYSNGLNINKFNTKSEIIDSIISKLQ